MMEASKESNWNSKVHREYRALRPQRTRIYRNDKNTLSEVKEVFFYW